MINLRLLICGFVASLAVSQTPNELRDLVKRAQDTNQVTRVDALDKLASYGEEAGPVAKDICNLLEKPAFRNDPFTLFAAINALGEMGNAAKGCIPALRRVLQDRKVDSANQGQATNAIWIIRLRDPNAEERIRAAKALATSSPSVIPALERALKDPDAGVRSAADAAIKRLRQ